jgi:hypothetical protein
MFSEGCHLIIGRSVAMMMRTAPTIFLDAEICEVSDGREHSKCAIWVYFLRRRTIVARESTGANGMKTDPSNLKADPMTLTFRCGVLEGFTLDVDDVMQLLLLD